MTAAYLLDLHQKILQAHARGIGSHRAISELFGVSFAFVERLLQRYRSTGGARRYGAPGRRRAVSSTTACARRCGSRCKPSRT